LSIARTGAHTSCTFLNYFEKYIFIAKRNSKWSGTFTCIFLSTGKKIFF